MAATCAFHYNYPGLAPSTLNFVYPKRRHVCPARWGLLHPESDLVELPKCAFDPEPCPKERLAGVPGAKVTFRPGRLHSKYSYIKKSQSARVVCAANHFLYLRSVLKYLVSISSVQTRINFHQGSSPHTRRTEDHRPKSDLCFKCPKTQLAGRLVY